MNIQEDMRVERTYDEEMHKRINHLLRGRTCVQMDQTKRSEDVIRVECWCFLLFALPTSDRVVTRAPLHLLYDFLYELLSSGLSYFSFRSLCSTASYSQYRATMLVVKFLLELVVLVRRIICLLQRRLFRQVICGSCGDTQWVDTSFCGNS